MAERITFTPIEEVPEDFTSGQPLFESSQFLPPPPDTAEAIPADQFLPPPPDTAEAIPAPEAATEKRSLGRNILNSLQQGTAQGVFMGARGTVNFLRGVGAEGQSDEDFDSYVQNFTEKGYADNPLGKAWIAFGKKVRGAEKKVRESLESAEETLAGAERMEYQKYPVDPEFAASKLGQIFKGVGQAGSSIAFWSLPGVGQIVGPMSAAGQIYQEAYDDAMRGWAERSEEEGLNLSDEEILKRAHSAGLAATPSAALEVVGERFVFGPILKALRGKIKVGDIMSSLGRVAGAGAVEGATEGAQQAWLNTIASKIAGYDPDRMLDDEVIDSIIVGAAVGFITGGLGEISQGTLAGIEKIRETKPVRDEAKTVANQASESMEASTEVLEEAAEAEQDLRTSASQIGDAAIEEVTSEERTNLDDVAEAQREIAQQSNLALENQKQVEGMAQQAAADLETSAQELEAAEEVFDDPEIQEGERLEQIQQGVEAGDPQAELAMIEELSGRPAEEDIAQATEGAAIIGEAEEKGPDQVIREIVADSIDPITAVERKYPEVAAAQDAEGDRLAGQFLVEIEDATGIRSPALFAGYWDEGIPAIGRWVPDANGFSHGMLKPGERIVSSVPTFEEWGNLQAMAIEQEAPGAAPVGPTPEEQAEIEATIQPIGGETDAIQEQEAVEVSGDEGTQGVRPLEEEIRGAQELATEGQEEGLTRQEQIQRNREEVAAAEQRNRRAVAGVKARRLARVAAPPDGNPDIISDIQDYGGIPAPRKGTSNNEMVRFRDAFPGSSRFLINTNGRGSRYGPGRLDTWLEDFLSSHPQYAPAGSLIRDEFSQSGFVAKVDQSVIDDFLDRIRPAWNRRMTILQQQVENRPREQLEAAMFANEKRLKRHRSDYTVNTRELRKGDEFTINGERFVVTDITEEGEVVIQDGLYYRMPDGEEFYPDRGSLMPLGARGRFFFTPEEEQQLIDEEAAQQAIDEGLGQPRVQGELEFEPPPPDSAEDPISELPQEAPRPVIPEEPSPFIDEEIETPGDVETAEDIGLQDQPETEYGAAEQITQPPVVFLPRDGRAGGFKRLPAVYVRFGPPPTEGPSGAFMGNRRMKDELGVSVYSAWRDPRTGKVVVPRVGTEDQSGVGDMAFGRTAYIVEGTELPDVGSDEETLLAPGSVRIVEEIPFSDIVEAEVGDIALDGTELAADEIPDWQDAEEVPDSRLQDESEIEYGAGEEWRRFIPAAEWAIAEEARRRANPQSVLDVTPEGFVVPYSEIRSRFPELFEGTNAIDNRADMGRAMDEVRAAQAQPGRRRQTRDQRRQQEIQDLLDESGLQDESEVEYGEPDPVPNEPSITRKRSQIRPEVSEILPNALIRDLPLSDLQKLIPTTARRLLDLYESLPSNAELKDIARLGAAGRDWYRDYRATIRAMGLSPQQDYLLSGVLAATSPNRPVSQNVRLALNTIRAWQAAGRPTDQQGILDSIRNVQPKVGIADRNNVVAVLSSPDMETAIAKMSDQSRKVKPFFRALMGDESQVVLDTHMARLYGIRQTKLSKPQMNRALTASVKNIARQLGWTPAQVQAAMWSVARYYGEQGAPARSPRIGGLVRPLAPLFAQPVSNQTLHRNDDIATLLTETFANDLSSLGFEPAAGKRELDRLRASRPADEGAGGGRTLSPRHQRSFSRRLEQRIDADQARTRGEQVADDRVAEQAAEYADRLDITDEGRRVGAEAYASEILEGTQDPGVAYDPEPNLDLDAPTVEPQAPLLPNEDVEVQVFLRTGIATREATERLAAGERISAVLAEHVSGEVPTFNINGTQLRTSRDFVDTQLALRSPYQESVKFAFLDSNGTVIHSGILSLGSVDSVQLDAGMLSQQWDVARRKSGVEELRVYVAHNHPSGSTRPSDADIVVAAKLDDWAQAQGGEVVDFVITNGEDYYSRNRGMSLPLPEPHRAPWEVTPGNRRRKIFGPGRFSIMVATLRQGNPTAEFIVWTDRQFGILGVEQIAPDSTNSFWVRKALEGQGALGAAEAFLITNKSNSQLRSIITGVKAGGLNILDASSDTIDSWRSAGVVGESSPTYLDSTLREQTEFEYGSQVQKAAQPFPIVSPPPAPPPAAVPEQTVKETVRKTGTAPPSAVSLAQQYPATEIAQWSVDSLDPADREGIDAEGLELLQNAPPEDRKYVPTRVFGTKFTVLGRRGGPDERLRAIQRASRVFREANLEVEFDERNEVYRLVDPMASQDEQGRELISIMERELAAGSADGSPLLSTLINSVRNPDGGLWKAPGFSQTTRNILFALAQAEASFYGLMLGALNRSKRSLSFVAEHVEVVLNKAYSDAFGGEALNKFMGQIRRDGSQIATDQIETKIPENLKGVFNRLDNANQQGVDLDYFMGAVLDQIGKGQRPRTPRPELQQLPSLFDLANWRLFITQRGGTQLAQRILRMINGEMTDNDGAEEGNVKRMDRLLQRDLMQIVREVMPKIQKERNQPNFLQELMVASGDLQSRTERLDVVDTEVRRGLDEAEAREMNDENADPDEIEAKYELLREKWDEQFTQISGTLTSQQMARRILNQNLKPIFERFNTSWSEIAQGKTSLERIKASVMEEVRREFAEFNDRAPEAAIDPARSDRMLGLLDQEFDAMAREKLENIRALRAAAEARRQAELPQRTAEQELRRLAFIHSDVQQWTTPEQNAVRDAIRDQRENPASPEVFEDTLRGLGVKADTARTLSKIVNRDIDVRRRHEQLRRERKIASPRPERGDQQTQERKTGIKGLVDRIFAAPPQQQNDPRWQRRTALEYFQENGLTEAEAEDAWNHFKTDFVQTLRQAARKGLEQMRRNLSQRERALLNRKSKGLQLWERLERAINAGVFDQTEILKEFAKEFGWTVPSDAQIQTLKALSNREQQLASLTEDERQRIGNDPDALEQARVEKAAATMNERLRIQNRMHSLYAQFSRPITLRTAEGRRNLGEAGREFISANMLFKLGFGVKQVIDVGTQFAVHMPLRGMAQAWYRHQQMTAAGEPTQFWQDFNGSLSNSLDNLSAFANAAIVQFRQAMAGEGVRRNIEGMRSTISGFDRMRAQALRNEQEIERLRLRGDFASLDKAADLVTTNAILKLMGLAEFALRFTRAMDNIQGVFVEQQEIRERLITELTLNGPELSPTEARVRANEILTDWRREQDLALARAQQIADENNLVVSPNELQANAYELFKARQYARIKAAGLDANAIAENTEVQRQTVGWNMKEESGIGGAVGAVVRALPQRVERLGLPLPLGQFSNAIAIGINRALTLSPLGFFPSLFGGVDESGRGENAWFRTQADRNQRKLEAALGTSVGLAFVVAAATGMIRVWLKPPDDPEEREIWQKAGHRAGTVEFGIPGTEKFIAVSLTSGPISLFRVPLTAIGAVQDMLDSAARRRENIEKEAAAKGVEPGEIPGVTMGDVAASASMGAFQAIMGGRTAGGALRSLRAGTDRDAMTLKTAIAAQASPFIVGLPAYQEMQRALETRLDPSQASIIELMFPTQGSDKRRYNFLSDELGPGLLQQATQTLTGGTFPLVDPTKLDRDPAYRVFRAIDYRPSPIPRQKGVFINGQIRPLTDEEYRIAQFERGRLLKEMVSDLDPTIDPPALTRMVSRYAELSKKMALQKVRATEITLESIDARDQWDQSARELHAEIMSLPLEDRNAAFDEALAEGRIPLQGGNVHPDFLSTWRTLSRQTPETANP